MHNVLLVEDCREIFTLVNQSIGSVVSLDWAASMDDAKKTLGTDYSLVLLDIELPDGNGIDLCSEIQNRRPQTAIFFITSHDNLSEKVLGFSAGADDYIVKPFVPLELKARVEAKLRKLDQLEHSHEMLKWTEIEINKRRQEVSIVNGAGFKKIDLTALEFKLLTYFADQVGSVVPRERVLNDIWGENVHVYPRSVDTHVSKLRKKLGPVSHIIESVHGTGYKFCPS